MCKIKKEKEAIPPLLHLEKQTASLVSTIMPSVQPYHHVVDIVASTVILLSLHPAEHLNALLN